MHSSSDLGRIYLSLLRDLSDSLKCMHHENRFHTRTHVSPIVLSSTNLVGLYVCVRLKHLARAIPRPASPLISGVEYVNREHHVICLKDGEIVSRARVSTSSRSYTLFLPLPCVLPSLGIVPTFNDHANYLSSSCFLMSEPTIRCSL